MAKQKATTGFGALPPRYHFALNPYPEMRFTRCPRCEAKTGQRKLPLMIHIDPDILLAFNYTNRYCKRCDLLIAHKVDIEHYLTEMFRTTGPAMIGNDYLIFGTVEKKAWQEGMRRLKPVHDMRAHIHDFKSYEERRMTMGGWFREDQTPHDEVLLKMQERPEEERFGIRPAVLRNSAWSTAQATGATVHLDYEITEIAAELHELQSLHRDAQITAFEQLAAINLNASRLTEAERNGMRQTAWSNLVGLEHKLLAAYEQAQERIIHSTP